MSRPLVSVLMTVYNREKFIAEAIESVLSQTYEIGNSLLQMISQVTIL